jgi:Ca-activated chloride channel family protein
MRVRLLACTACCAGLLVSGSLLASSQQESNLDAKSAPSEAPTFKLESELVVLHVSIFDRSGDAVRGLGQEAFHVIEDGVPQAITFFGGEDVPVAVGLVVDNSGSMLTRRGMVLAGVKAFADSSRPDDEAFTVIFNENVRRGLPDSVPFTHNGMLLQSTLGRFPAGGRTALYDAVSSSLDHLETAARQKHVLVVLSDGADNASRASEADMLRKAERADALIYTVSTARLDTGLGNESLLRRLARLSGGESYSPRSEAQVVSAFAEIAAKVRRGYSIGYVPTNGAHDGTRRRVTVQVRSPNLRSPRVYTRDGYLAPLHDHQR